MSIRENPNNYNFEDMLYEVEDLAETVRQKDPLTSDEQRIQMLANALDYIVLAIREHTCKQKK